GAIRGDRLLATPERLERVSDRQVQISRLRCTDQELAVNFDGTFVCAKTYVGQRTERAVVTIGGINGEQLLALLLSVRVHVPLDKDLGIVKSRGVIVRRQIEHRLQQ